MLASINNTENKINIQSYIFGVQHKSVIELTLLQIGGLNEYDKMYVIHVFTTLICIVCVT